MKKHSVLLYGHATSFSLEDEFWTEFKNIALEQKKSLSALLHNIDANRTTNLSCAIRIFVLQELKKKVQ